MTARERYERDLAKYEETQAAKRKAFKTMHAAQRNRDRALQAKDRAQTILARSETALHNAEREHNVALNAWRGIPLLPKPKFVTAADPAEHVHSLFRGAQ